MTASKPQVTWTCDRCGKQIELGVGTQPDGWVGIVTVAAPLMATDEGKRNHLCLQCGRQHKAWMSPATVSAA